MGFALLLFIGRIRAQFALGRKRPAVHYLETFFLLAICQ
jgi:hypothetical protein